MQSHFFHMLLYATIVATFFAVMLRRLPKEQLRLGGILWLAMVGGAMVLADEERSRLATQYENGVTEIKRLQEDMQARFKKIEMEVMVEVQEVIRDVIDEWGKANDYDLILDASTLVYVSDKADVTGKIIKAVDKSVQEGE